MTIADDAATGELIITVTHNKDNSIIDTLTVDIAEQYYIYHYDRMLEGSLSLTVDQNLKEFLTGNLDLADDSGSAYSGRVEWSISGDVFAINAEGVIAPAEGNAMDVAVGSYENITISAAYGNGRTASVTVTIVVDRMDANM